GQEMVGGESLNTFTVRVTVTAELLLGSFTSYERIYVPSVLTFTLPVTWIWLVRSPAQVSTAVAPGSVKGLCHITFIVLEPIRVMTGGVVWVPTTVRPTFGVFVPAVAW